ncbi:MAG TPA: aminotransferase class III-fold pyridoxal phosphate-dependent enzyme [Candidatus Limnocylindrales bacterium]|nr:aminotransferase class III-fold pyridoxal phosphate-dependent enzyme [Candidatus Limnocylindrales bacterium]
MAGRVFRRTLDPSPPVAVRAEGATIWDADGKAYLDAAGGAIVVGIGHGRRSVAEVMAKQAGAIAFAHGSAFTSEPLERYADAVGRHLPMPDPAIYPVAGGSEAMETALKMARAYHLARGERDRWIVIARWGSYHGNTLGALDLSGRKPLRRPYEAWLGRFRHVSAAYPYRAGEPSANALGTTEDLAEELERTIAAAGPGTVAAFVGEPIVGATLGAVAPPAGYWPAIAEVCRRHGVLLVADEVMTGFGRTGRWFGIDHSEVQPDILVAAKGSTSGYTPFGFAAASGEVHDAIMGGGGFVHGFTYSHHVVGSAVAAEVLRILEAEALVDASATKGERLRAMLQSALGDHPHVGDIRVHGLFAGLELVADRETREPFARSEKVAERIVRGARGKGLLVYSGTGMADGTNGDAILLGPPFIVTDDELATIVERLAEAIGQVTAGQPAGAAP